MNKKAAQKMLLKLKPGLSRFLCLNLFDLPSSKQIPLQLIQINENKNNYANVDIFRILMKDFLNQQFHV